MSQRWFSRVAFLMVLLGLLASFTFAADGTLFPLSPNNFTVNVTGNNDNSGNHVVGANTGALGQPWGFSLRSFFDAQNISLPTDVNFVIEDVNITNGSASGTDQIYSRVPDVASGFTFSNGISSNASFDDEKGAGSIFLSNATNVTFFVGGNNFTFKPADDSLVLGFFNLSGLSRSSSDRDTLLINFSFDSLLSNQSSNGTFNFGSALDNTSYPVRSYAFWSPLSSSTTNVSLSFLNVSNISFFNENDSVNSSVSQLVASPSKANFSVGLDGSFNVTMNVSAVPAETNFNATFYFIVNLAANSSGAFSNAMASLGMISLATLAVLFKALF